MSAVPLAGVIGKPVGHSKSPRLHGHWLAQLGLRGAYVPLEVDASDLVAVLGALPCAGFVGANVTIPHKEAALALADEVTDGARAIGAANTLVFRAGRIFADKHRSQTGHDTRGVRKLFYVPSSFGSDLRRNRFSVQNPSCHECSSEL